MSVRDEYKMTESSGMRKENKYSHIATIILCISAVGALIFYPFRNNLAGGFIASGFIAATIGGLADWFGVSALFIKPLGIPFKTELIKRNKTRLFDSLVHMVEYELLTKENLKARLDRIFIPDVITGIFIDEDEKKAFISLFESVVHEFIKGINEKEASDFLKNLAMTGISSFDASSFLADILKWLEERGYVHQLLSFAAKELREVLTGSETIPMLEGFAQRLKARISEGIENEKAGRKLLLGFVMNILNISGASSFNLAIQARQELMALLNESEIKGSDTRKKIENWLSENIARLKSGHEMAANIDRKFEKFVGDLDIYSMLEKLSIYALTDAILKEFSTNKELGEKIDSGIKNWLYELLDTNHVQIGKLVREKLNSYSDQTLVNLIKDKAGDDLQIIRVNGSLTGGIAGMLLHLLALIPSFIAG